MTDIKPGAEEHARALARQIATMHFGKEPMVAFPFENDCQRIIAAALRQSAAEEIARLTRLLSDLTTAAGRLAFAAETSGGVAGRDDGLCIELDRIAQPLGAARAALRVLSEITND
jgi:hypothetical protein